MTSKFGTLSTNYAKADLSNIDSSAKAVIQTSVNNNYIDPATGKFYSALVPSVGSAGVHVVATYGDLLLVTGQLTGALGIVQTNPSREFIWDGATWDEFDILPTALENLSNVLITSPQDQESLVYDQMSNKWVNGMPPSSASVLSLTDTQITLPITNGDVLKYNSTSNAWENQPDGAGNNTLAGLDDVDETGQQNNYLLSYQSATTNYKTVPGLTSKGDLLSVSSTGIYTRLPYNAVNGQVLVTNTASVTGLDWQTPSGGASLATLSDATITTPVDGQFLVYENATSKWKNTNLDSRIRITDDATPSKVLQFQLSGLNASTTYTMSVDNTQQNFTVANLSGSQSLSNKTLTSCSFVNNTISGLGNIVDARYLWSSSNQQINVSSTTPAAGQVLTATSTTQATWQTPTVPALSVDQQYDTTITNPQENDVLQYKKEPHKLMVNDNGDIRIVDFTSGTPALIQTGIVSRSVNISYATPILPNLYIGYDCKPTTPKLYFSSDCVYWTLLPSNINSFVTANNNSGGTFDVNGILDDQIVYHAQTSRLYFCTFEAPSGANYLVHATYTPGSSAPLVFSRTSTNIVTKIGGLAVSTDGTKILARCMQGGTNHYISTNSGTTFTAISMSTITNGGTGGDAGWYAIFNPANSLFYVGIGDSYLMTSPDFVTWTRRMAGITVRGLRYAASSNKLIAVQGGTSNVLTVDAVDGFTVTTGSIFTLGGNLQVLRLRDYGTDAIGWASFHDCPQPFYMFRVSQLPTYYQYSVTSSGSFNNPNVHFGLTNSWQNAQMSGGSTEFATDVFRIKDATDATKKVAFDLASLTTATTRTLTVPDADGTMILTNATQSMQNKTLNNPNNNIRANRLAHSAGSLDIGSITGPTEGQVLSFQSGNPIWRSVAEAFTDNTHTATILTTANPMVWSSGNLVANTTYATATEYEVLGTSPVASSGIYNVTAVINYQSSGPASAVLYIVLKHNTTRIGREAVLENGTNERDSRTMQFTRRVTAGDTVSVWARCVASGSSGQTIYGSDQTNEQGSGLFLVKVAN